MIDLCVIILFKTLKEKKKAICEKSRPLAFIK